MLLTFEKIREISLNEKQEKLQKLPPDFFMNSKEYLLSTKGAREELSAKNLIENIFARRQKKIMTLCFHLYKTDTFPENLEEEEQEYYKEMIKLLNSFYENFRKKIIDSQTGEKEKEAELVEKPLREEENNKDIIYKKPIEQTENKINIIQPMENNIAPTNQEMENTKIIKKELEYKQIENQRPVDEIKKETELNKTEEEAGKIKVIFLKEIPEIISPDFKVYCFKENEEKELDKNFAEILLKKELCKVV